LPRWCKPKKNLIGHSLSGIKTSDGSAASGQATPLIAFQGEQLGGEAIA
jgi:hypothetical protein